MENYEKLIIFLDIPYEVQLETRDWRNSEEVTKYCKISYIDEDVHKKWLLSLQSKEKYCICYTIFRQKYRRNLFSLC